MAAVEDRSRNIDIWKDAEVYVTSNEDLKFPADGSDPQEGWEFVGLLNGGSTIGRESDINRTEVQSFGGVLQLTDVRFNKDTRTFTALESNEVTFSLIWPNSEYKTNEAGVLLAPENDAERVIAFKTTNSHGDTEIQVSRRPAIIYPAAQDKNDEGATTTDFTVEVRKDDEGGLYDWIRVPAGESVAKIPEVIKFDTASGGSVGELPQDPGASE